MEYIPALIISTSIEQLVWAVCAGIVAFISEYNFQLSPNLNRTFDGIIFTLGSCHVNALTTVLEHNVPITADETILVKKGLLNLSLVQFKDLHILHDYH